MSTESYTVEYTRFAETDLSDAVAWFNEVGAPQVIERFFQTIDAAQVHLKRNPHIYPKVKHDIRVVYIKPFRHGLYFRILENRVLVIACQHSSRNPIFIDNVLTVR